MNDETVDTQESVPEQAVVDTVSDTVEPAEAADTSDVSSDDSSDPDLSFDWNGELESLQDIDWLQGVDGGVKDSLIKGIEAKYKNWQRGYTKSFQDNADKRKALETKEAEIAQQELRVQKWLYGEADPMTDLKSQIDEMKSKHESALQELMSKYETATSQNETVASDELKKLILERDDAIQRINAFEEAARYKEQVELDSAVDEFEDWIKGTAPDIWENEDAFYSLCVLCTGGLERADALAMVRGKYNAPAPAPEPPKAKPVPESVKMMSMGAERAGATTSGESRSFDDIMDDLRRQAQGQVKNILGS
jgi:hypothetical protein